MRDWELISDPVTLKKHLLHLHVDPRKQYSEFSCCTRRCDDRLIWYCNYCYYEAPDEMCFVADLAGCVNGDSWYSREFIDFTRKRKNERLEHTERTR